MSKGLSLSDLAKRHTASSTLQFKSQSRSSQPSSGGPSLSDLAAQHSSQGGGGAPLPVSEQPSLSSLASLHMRSDPSRGTHTAGAQQPAMGSVAAVHMAQHKPQLSAVQSSTTSTPAPLVGPLSTSASSSATFSLAQLASLHTATPRGSVITPGRCSSARNTPSPSLLVARTATHQSATVFSSRGMSTITHSIPSSRLPSVRERHVQENLGHLSPSYCSATTLLVNRPVVSSTPSLSDLASLHCSTSRTFPATTISQMASSHVPSSAASSPSFPFTTTSSVSKVATLCPGTFTASLTSSSSSTSHFTTSTSSVTPHYMQSGSGCGQHPTTGEYSGFTFSTPPGEGESPQLSLSDLVKLHSVPKDGPQSEGWEHSATGRPLAHAVYPGSAVEQPSPPTSLPRTAHHQPSLADLAYLKKQLPVDKVSPHPPPGFSSLVTSPSLPHSSLQSSRPSPTARLTHIRVDRLHSHPESRATTSVSVLTMASDHYDLCGRVGAVLAASPSLFGVTVCRTARLRKEGVVYREVSRTHQLVVKGLVTAFHSNCTFNFSSPSPDEIVKQKQTEGFSRKYN